MQCVRSGTEQARAPAYLIISGTLTRDADPNAFLMKIAIGTELA